MQWRCDALNHGPRDSGSMSLKMYSSIAVIAISSFGGLFLWSSVIKSIGALSLLLAAIAEACLRQTDFDRRAEKWVTTFGDWRWPYNRAPRHRFWSFKFRHMVKSASASTDTLNRDLKSANFNPGISVRVCLRRADSQNRRGFTCRF